MIYLSGSVNSLGELVCFGLVLVFLKLLGPSLKYFDLETSIVLLIHSRE